MVRVYYQMSNTWSEGWGNDSSVFILQYSFGFCQKDEEQLLAFMAKVQSKLSELAGAGQLSAITVDSG